MKNTVWVLTEEYNEYDQYGEYFLAVFKEKATIEQLMKFKMSKEVAIHVQNGGGRIKTEDQWFNLKEENLE